METEKGELLTRLALCAAVAVAVLYGAEKLCDGKSLPLWEKYGPWLMENRIQAIAVLAAVFYGASLALLPGHKESSPEADGFEPCT